MVRIAPRFVALLAGLALVATASHADAFCGFYVGGAGAKLFNNATQVVMMRDGQRTVLAMQNDYQGPPQGFAMVVPVPVVLKKENVRTLDRAVFEHVDMLTAPRLVEYWEADPCARDDDGYGYRFSDDPLAAGGFGPNDATIRVRAAPVRIEAKFVVGEYDIVILGADDSGALDRWLRDNGYAIPAGAEPVLRPYVQQGMKFFVAKVDVAKVKIENGHAALSPLRFHYDTPDFMLPVRLGLLSSAGTQDLIVNILAKNQRYEVSNYDNVAIPTNLGVNEAARDQFGAFYAGLFDGAIAGRPRAVVTEYAWQTASCDPCPTPPLEPSDIDALGGDVVLKGDESRDGFVVTRLHARYTKDALGDDLHFRAAGPIEGGRGVPKSNGELGEKTAQPSRSQDSAFQGRYVVRHPWTGAVTCEKPQRGRWGGPPSSARGASPIAATNIGMAPRGAQLAAFLTEPLPPGVVMVAPPMTSAPKSGGCAGCRAGGDAGDAWLAGGAVIGVAIVARRRRRKR